MTDIQNNASEDQVIEAMKAEEKDAGIPSTFPEDEPTPKADEPTAPEVKPEVTPEVKPEAKPDETTRQSRAPLRERIREGVEAKVKAQYDEKLAEAIAEYKKGNPLAPNTSDIEADIKATAAELGVDEEQVRKIVMLARKGHEDKIKELETNLSEKDKKEKELQDEKEAADQEKIFNTEWKELAPAIKEKFPNASPEQLAKAEELMDEFAFTDKYHSVDLDYILHKEAPAFEKVLFSPKVKGFESSSTPEADLENEDADPFSKPFDPKSYKDVEKMDKKMKSFEESLPDDRFRF